MSGFAELFAGVNFQTTIQRYCASQGWKIADLNDQRARLGFTMGSGSKQTLYILKYDTTLEFSVQSALAYPSVDAIPDFVSTLLLKRNVERTIGFWCIEELQGMQVYSCMHNADMRLIDSACFGRIVRALLDEVEDFEQTLRRL